VKREERRENERKEHQLFGERFLDAVRQKAVEISARLEAERANPEYKGLALILGSNPAHPDDAACQLMQPDADGKVPYANGYRLVHADRGEGVHLWFLQCFDFTFSEHLIAFRNALRNAFPDADFGFDAVLSDWSSGYFLSTADGFKECLKILLQVLAPGGSFFYNYTLDDPAVLFSIFPQGLVVFEYFLENGDRIRREFPDFAQFAVPALQRDSSAPIVPPNGGWRQPDGSPLPNGF
jgi:hypothetical protein